MVNGQRAVFFDRDGVLTEPVWNPATGDHESAHHLADARLCPNLAAPLRALHAAGYLLFIVSNQPSFAKGKTTIEEIEAIAAWTEASLHQAGVTFRASYYCHHHPDSFVPGYGGACPCRKPSSYFLHLAAARYRLDLSLSWMLGDRDTDIECGQRAGCRTILITHPHAGARQGRRRPTCIAADVAAAVETILGAPAAPSLAIGGAA